jgi:hypothetical protein
MRDGGPADFRDTPSSPRCTGYSGGIAAFLSEAGTGSREENASRPEQFDKRAADQ